VTALPPTREQVHAAAGAPARMLRANRLIAMRRRVKDSAHSETGSALIEFAVSLSLMMTFVLVLMQICIAFYTYGMISECAREATRYASVHGSSCLTSGSSPSSCTATVAQFNTYATSRGFPNIGGGTLLPNTTYPDSNELPGSRVLVQITYSLSTSLPLVPKKTISLQVSSEMHILQ